MKQDVQHLDIFPNYGKVVAHPWSLKRKLIYKVVPAHVFHPLRNELHLAWVRLKSLNARKQFEHAEDLLVNLGAGPKGKPGWINVDTHPYEGINCVYDCRKSLPFPDNSVRGIFSEHFFEHLDYTEEVPWFLSECHRVLKPGGVFRVIVPDIELYMQAYCTDGWEELSKIRPLESDHRDSCYKCKINVKMELINLVFRQGDEHKYAYDFDTLKFLLDRYGFSRTVKKTFGESLQEELCIDQPARACESLYVEGVK